MARRKLSPKQIAAGFGGKRRQTRRSQSSPRSSRASTPRKRASMPRRRSSPRRRSGGGRKTIKLASTLVGINAAMQMTAPYIPVGQAAISGDFQGAKAAAMTATKEAFSRENLLQIAVPALALGLVKAATSFLGFKPGFNAGRRRISVLA